MSQKCLHKGCGKLFDSPTESPCVYHPGLPVFHEGQKGWKCCKPRVLTFDEFLDIQPCTTGQHSAVDDTPAPAPPPSADLLEETIAKQQQSQTTVPRVPIATASSTTKQPDPVPESEDDDPGADVPVGATCRRKGCGVRYGGDKKRESEKCIYHPGAPIFHEGSKGYSCCKRRVLEFDQFLRIEGCKEKNRHLFVGSGKDARDGKLNGTTTAGAESNDSHSSVCIDPASTRTDFYQTPTTLVASLFLKQIDASQSTIVFEDGQTIALDLKTKDGKRYKSPMRLWGKINPEKSSFKILGTKLELELAKVDGMAWLALREGDRGTGEIIQSGRAGRV